MLDVQGQSRAQTQLQRALTARRLASTWIFAGPLGVGKFRLAVDLAKTIMCDSPFHRPNGADIPLLAPDFQLTLPCNACESCRAVENRTHPDLHIITKELIRYHDKGGKSKGTTLSIDVIRGEITGDTQEGKEAKVYKRAIRGRGKFFIIDEADLMEGPAQNSLLKTLEEPPNETYMILITTSPGELLSTIRSRSQIVLFNELPEHVVIAGLIGAGLNSDDAALMARLARGSLGRALGWATDIAKVAVHNAKDAERAAKKAVASTAAADADDDDNAPTRFTPGGILTCAHNFGALLDQLVAGRVAASEVASFITAWAAEFADIHTKFHDKLASEDRAKRDAIALLMTIAAEWFSDRLRHALGTPHATPLPGITGALDHALVPDLIASARAAEAEIDMNANDKILLAATTTRWEQLLHQDT